MLSSLQICYSDSRLGVKCPALKIILLIVSFISRLNNILLWLLQQKMLQILKFYQWYQYLRASPLIKGHIGAKRLV